MGFLLIPTVPFLLWHIENTRWPSYKRDFSYNWKSVCCNCTDRGCCFDLKLNNAHLSKKMLQIPSLANTHLILAQTISFYLQMLFLKSHMISLYGLVAWVLSINYLHFSSAGEQTQQKSRTLICLAVLSVMTNKHGIKCKGFVFRKIQQFLTCALSFKGCFTLVSIRRNFQLQRTFSPAFPSALWSPLLDSVVNYFQRLIALWH